MKSPGYRLYWENSDETGPRYATLRDVRAAIRKAARECGITIKQATALAYIMPDEDSPREDGR